MVCSLSPSMLAPALETNRANLRSCLAAQSALVQCSVRVPLALSVTSVGAPHTGQVAGMSSVPTVCITSITLGIILLALITDRVVPGPPMPRRSHSLMLQSEARFTVVPSRLTGVKTATGEMVDAAHDHSMWSSWVCALSSCHLKA